ncbi:MAG: DNA-binding protein [Nitrospirae bacterium]|nr:DNA-binding protein [Nitrospirota bacterium]
MKKSTMLFVLMLTLALTGGANSVHAFSQASPPQGSPGADPVTMSAISGKVVEALDSGGYTYVNVEKDGKKTWVAVPQMKVKVGQNISFRPGAEMGSFTSKTLDRTFDSIIFSAGVIQQPDAKPADKTAAGKKADAPAVKPAKVEKAPGKNAYTVAELHEKSAKLEKKGVVVKGQVVKYSPGIMGKNWIHLQDGSGDSSKGTNDILVTSQDVVAVGDVVTAKGTLYTNKDFGSGYKFAVIVEEAGVKK